jgi:hypothetical protein
MNRLLNRRRSAMTLQRSRKFNGRSNGVISIGPAKLDVRI